MGDKWDVGSVCICGGINGMQAVEIYVGDK